MLRFQQSVDRYDGQESFQHLNYMLSQLYLQVFDISGSYHPVRGHIPFVLVSHGFLWEFTLLT